MIDLPIPLRLKTVTTKVSAESWSEVQSLAKKHGFRISDVLAACVVLAKDEDVVELLNKQQTIINKIPKSILGVMRNQDKLSDEDREMLMLVLGK